MKYILELVDHEPSSCEDCALYEFGSCTETMFESMGVEPCCGGKVYKLTEAVGIIEEPKTAITVEERFLNIEKRLEKLEVGVIRDVIYQPNPLQPRWGEGTPLDPNVWPGPFYVTSSINAFLKEDEEKD